MKTDIICKIVIIGDLGVGKTSVIQRFTNNEFVYNVKATAGVDFIAKNLNIRGKSVSVQIWDTAGQERFQSIAPGYTRGAKGVIVTYDITKKTSFQCISRWINDAAFHWSDDEDVERMLIGNKSDLEEQRKVEMAEGEKEIVKQKTFKSQKEDTVKLEAGSNERGGNDERSNGKSSCC